MSGLLLDCTFGSRKDTFSKAMVSLLDDPAGFDDAMDEKVAHFRDDKKHHRSLSDVLAIIASARLAPRAQEYAFDVYDIIALAEADVHGETKDRVHFHEVGSGSAIAAICRACAAIDLLDPDVILSTEICTGFGYVDCAHGRLAIPAPATANILEGLPVFEGDIEGELTTPTGAALVKFFASGYIDRSEAVPDLIEVLVG